MTAWDLPGQPRAAGVLRGAVKRAEVSHAWAFVGPGGVGQQQAARTLAAALNCPDASEGEPCGACATCDRCLRGAHCAYWEFVPVGTSHRVTEVREQWLRTASRSAAEGDWKVLRVVDADRMNEAAANAFLKGLEEPAPGTVWILEVADPDELPDTILSRCRVVRFGPWSPDQLEHEAARLGITPGPDLRLAVRSSMGSATALARFASGEALADLRAHREIPRRLREQGPGHALVAARAIDEEVRRGTKALRQEAGEAIAALDDLYGDRPPRGVVKQLEDRQARQERELRGVVVTAALDDLLAWLRDCVVVAAGGSAEATINADDPEGLRADADAFGVDGLLEACDLVLASRDSFERNVGQALALEALFLSLSALALTAPSATSG